MGSAISRRLGRSLSFILTGNSTGACAPAPGPLKLIWCPAPSTVTQSALRVGADRVAPLAFVESYSRSIVTRSRTVDRSVIVMRRSATVTVRRQRRIVHAQAGLRNIVQQ